MPFKGPSGYYYSEIVIGGYGQMPRLSLGAKRIKHARLLEEALRDVGRAALVRPHLYDLLDAVKPQGRGKSGQISPADLLRAKNEPQGYERLYRKLNDPPIPAVLDAYLEETEPTRADKYAHEVIRDYAGNKTYTYLLDASNVQSLLEEIEKGEEKKRASVCRFEKTLISKLIRWRSGGSARNKVFENIKYSRGDDTRRVRFEIVTEKALSKLVHELREGYWKEGDELAPLFVRVAVTTGVTISPFSRTVNEDLFEEKHGKELWGRLNLRGTKKVKTSRGDRDRPILILPAIWTQLRTYWNKDAPKEEAFPLEYTRFYTIWKKAAKRAGLESAVLGGNGKRTRLRPHDLRSVFSRRADRAGISATAIGSGLGHSDHSSTMRYMTNEDALSRAEVKRIGDVA